MPLPVGLRGQFCLLLPQMESNHRLNYGVMRCKDTNLNGKNGDPGGSRTHTNRILNPAPLPFGLRDQKVAASLRRSRRLLHIGAKSASSCMKASRAK